MGSGPRFGLQLQSADDRNGGHLEGDWAVVAFSPSDLRNLDLRSPGAGQAVLGRRGPFQSPAADFHSCAGAQWAG